MNQDKIANTAVHLESTEPRSKNCHMKKVKNKISSKQGCPYCTMSKDGNIVGKDFGEGEYHVVITNTGRICSKMSIWDFSTRSVKINFCPMCGTELNTNKAKHNAHTEILAELKECLSNMENDEFNTVMDSFEKSNDN